MNTTQRRLLLKMRGKLKLIRMYEWAMKMGRKLLLESVKNSVILKG